MGYHFRREGEPGPAELPHLTNPVTLKGLQPVTHLFSLRGWSVKAKFGQTTTCWELLIFVIKYEFSEIRLFLQNSGLVNFSKEGYSLLEKIKFRLCYFRVTASFLCRAINFNLRIATCGFCRT